MEWQTALPSLNAWFPNTWRNFSELPALNAFNPYRSEYVHTLSEQTQLRPSRINEQRIYDLPVRFADSSTTYSGSQPIQREIDYRHLYPSQTHRIQVQSSNQGALHIPDRSSSSFNPPEANPGVGFPTAKRNQKSIPTAQRNQKSCNSRPHDSDGKFKSRVEYPLSVKLGAKKWKQEYLEGSIPNPNGQIGTLQSRKRIWYKVLKMYWDTEYVKWCDGRGEILPIPSPPIIYAWSITDQSALVHASRLRCESRCDEVLAGVGQGAGACGESEGCASKFNGDCNPVGFEADAGRAAAGAAAAEGTADQYAAGAAAADDDDNEPAAGPAARAGQPKR